MLFITVYVECHTEFSKLTFQQAQNMFVSHVDTAADLKVCCASDGAGARTHLESKILRLMFPMRALPGLHLYLFSVLKNKRGSLLLAKSGNAESKLLLCLLSIVTGEGVGLFCQLGFYYSDPYEYFKTHRSCMLALLQDHRVNFPDFCYMQLTLSAAVKQQQIWKKSYLSMLRLFHALN